MIKSYFRYAFRNLVKQRGRTLINLIGLSFSMALVIIIYLYTRQELSYNNFHENKDRIYRMYSGVDIVGEDRYYSPFQTPEMADALQERVPGIERTCLLKATPVFIGPEEELFQEYVGFVDSTFFEMFSYEFLAGDRSTPLDHPKSAVITESVARKIFRDSLLNLNDVIGKTLEFPEKPPSNMYTITAVIADQPKNSSFRWTVLVPYGNAGVYPRSNDFMGDSYLYVMLDENNDAEQLEATAQLLIEEFMTEGLQAAADLGYVSIDDHNFKYYFMAVKDLYLHSRDFRGSYERVGNMNAIYILCSIAILILLIACFNYVMISIGTAMNRIGDFGLMNVAGARRWQILAQFVVESFLLTLISMLLGIILAEQLLPLFNKLANEELRFTLYDSGLNFLFLLAILCFIVLSTSAYIGLYLLRRSNPIRFLRKEILSVRRNGVARVSVVLQFFIAIVLLISGSIILKQLNYMTKHEVGFDRQDMVVIHVDFALSRINTLKEKILESPHVKGVTMSDRSFVSGSSSQSIRNKEGEPKEIRLLRVDHDYIKTLSLELLRGRNFKEGEKIDSIPNVLVNESLVAALGLEDPIGERVEMGFGGITVHIIGVVRDFHFDSMKDEIQPLVLHTFPYNSIWYLFVKADRNMEAVLDHCEKAWNEVVPEFSWEYSFMDENLEKQYTDEDRWSRIIAYASVIAILLSCLGLMGISGLLVARRYKEVGIRKANGATVGKVIVLLNRNLLKWVLVAYILACPAAWVIAKRWLQDFAYQTSLSWWIFALAGLAALVISVFTITFQIYRVARQNPVDALRYE